MFFMKENNDRRNRGKKRFRNEPQVPKIQINILPCGLCNEPIVEMANAIAFGAEQKPCHFDCVINEIRKDHSLMPEEKITYIGSGAFAVIVEKENFQFEIRKKITVEDLSNPPEWRKELKSIYKNNL